MRALGLVAVPAVASIAALAWPKQATRPLLLPVAAFPHLLLALWCLIDPGPPVPAAWLAMDVVARAVLPLVSLLFLVAALYAVAYLKLRAERNNRIFVAALLGMLALLSLALQAQHLGLLWVAAEAATMVTVPLLHFNRSARAYEATWKYLLVGGTGLALSLMGTFGLGYASLQAGGAGDLTFLSLSQQVHSWSPPWLTLAWVLLLAGYGTKMGVAPMHTWKPDAYGEAPGIVGTMLAGGMTTMAFVAVLRVKAVVDRAMGPAMTTRTLLGLGLLSMALAALFLLRTRDFKRLLAYSSVEHMGILAIGAALGRAGTAAALFHVWTNGMTKGALFFTAGNLRRIGGGRTADEVGGLRHVAPASAALFVTGLFAVTACPPFGVFFSEIQILRAALDSGRPAVAGGFVACLLVAFFGLTRLVFAIVDGEPKTVAPPRPELRDTLGVIGPPLACLLAALWLGLAPPQLLADTWRQAAAWLGDVP
ncbi:MAG: Fe-S-binding domain-containing protein [Deltaproteobacteria bacterium]|nr:Fe-S-binding domain-containing protein [Deltaproteobacteria bacterium]